jgi:hypothetical protein
MKNWRKRIPAARARGRFTAADNVAAGEWPDCACGQQDARIPRNERGMPLDETLCRLGVKFCVAVGKNDFDKSASLLAQIEGRAAEIIAEDSA